MAGNGPRPSEEASSAEGTVSPRSRMSVANNRVRIPIEALGDFFDLASIIQSGQLVGNGQHRITYRSTLGQRIRVSVTSETTAGSSYTHADPRDHRAQGGRVWRHNGSIPTGELGWQRSAALLEVTHAATDTELPSSTIQVSVTGDAPYSNPRSCTIKVPLT